MAGVCKNLCRRLLPYPTPSSSGVLCLPLYPQGLSLPEGWARSDGKIIFRPRVGFETAPFGLPDRNSDHKVTEEFLLVKICHRTFPFFNFEDSNELKNWESN
uniref:Uncharacterized protein n=1 Tax=Cacopsylla melanoneura TaxID=428564 RepID=A0A8D8MF52_9HEMI